MEYSAGVVIYRLVGKKRLYLLLHYNKKHWDFPKGHLEKGESDIEAAIRETDEETGINELDFVEGFSEKISYYFIAEGKKIHKSVVYFLAKTTQSEVTLSDEHIGFEWLVYEEALQRLTFKNSREVLEKCNKHLDVIE